MVAIAVSQSACDGKTVESGTLMVEYPHRSRATILIVIAVVAWLCSVIAHAEESKTKPAEIKVLPEAATDAKTFRVEWFHLLFIGGNWGLGLEVGFPKLLWKYVYLSTLQGGASTSLWESHYLASVYGGPAVGYPLILDADSRHELRFGLSPGVAVFAYDDALCRDNPRHLVGWVGFALMPEVYYTFHHRLSVQVGFKAVLAVVGDGTCAYPPAQGYVGFVGIAY
ncbi:MAG: hypothetical protein C4523_17160 [Myxococcales bacterium]|nr:MAG: hypothetical protein C4523_17160 [Myxococcales bacterium]